MVKEFKQVDIICPVCGDGHSVRVHPRDLSAWRDFGVLAQDAFPYLSATKREQLISGLCPKCQEDFFGGEDG